MNQIQPPSSKIGNHVEFAPPVSVGGLPARKGTIKDEIWSEIYPDEEWGHYIYTSQLIEWDEGGRSIRLTYYYWPPNAERWLFGGPHSIEDNPDTIRKVLIATLSRDWYGPSSG